MSRVRGILLLLLLSNKTRSLFFFCHKRINMDFRDRFLFEKILLTKKAQFSTWLRMLKVAITPKLSVYSNYALLFTRVTFL